LPPQEEHFIHEPPRGAKGCATWQNRQPAALWLASGIYVPIDSIAGRQQSQVLGPHLERHGENLRLFDPVTGERLLTRPEARGAAERLTVEERQRALAAEAARQSLAEENERLRREIEALRGG
jgi:hypothetical protein